MARPLFSDEKYVEYRPGDANIILTVPHGGNLRPSHVPNRDAGGYVNGTIIYSHDIHVVKDYDKAHVRYRKDTYTQELALMISDQIQALINKRPHVVMCHLYRGKLDVNCDLEKAAFRIKEMEDAWHAWHNFINMAKSAIGVSHGRGLMFDVHGQIHPEGWIELGYTLSSEALNTGNLRAEDTSIYGLLKSHDLTSSTNLHRVLSGEGSLGALIQKEGYKVVPSPMYPSPGSGNYYTGGHNTVFHGSHKGGNIDAIQLENPKHLRNGKAAPSYASALARAITTYMDAFYSHR